MQVSPKQQYKKQNRNICIWAVIRSDSFVYIPHVNV